MVYDLEMQLNDLSPKHDPKGGSPKSPSPIPVSEYESQVCVNGSSTWRTIAMVEATIIISGAAFMFTLGVDNVKHSEIDQIMATRAPYIHAAPLIEARFKTLETADESTREVLRELRDEFRKGDDSIMGRINELEKNYYREHPEPK